PYGRQGSVAGNLPDPGGAAIRRTGIWLAGGEVRSPADPHAEYHQLLRRAVADRLRAESRHAARVTRAVRLRHGRRMGSRGGAGARDPAGPQSWLFLRNAAGGLRPWLPLGVDPLRRRVRSGRLAGPVRHQFGFGAARSLRPLPGRGVARVAGRGRAAPGIAVRDLERGESVLPDALLSGTAHGVLQRFLARLAGPVSDL